MSEDTYISRALVVAEPWIDLILSGEKTWEMRSSSNRIRGWVGLIRKGSGHIVGAVKMTGCGVSLSKEELLGSIEQHRIPVQMIGSGEIGKWTVPWYMEGAVCFEKPVPYRHPSGAVTWVSLEDEVALEVSARLGRQPAVGASLIFAEPRRKNLPMATQTFAPPVSTGLMLDAVERFSGAERLIGAVRVNPSSLTDDHLSLRKIIKLLPETLIDGQGMNPPCFATLTAEGMPAVSTDICPRHIFFRDRSWTRQFFSRNDAKVADMVEVWEVGERHYRLQLIKG